MSVRKESEAKKDLILNSEMTFASQIGAEVFEKPSISFWMILIPILFLHFVYRMQKYRSGRLKFTEEFMITRRRAMDLAVEAMQAGVKPEVDRVVRQAGLPETLEEPYGLWVRALVEYYGELLTAEGEDFESLVRSAYSDRTNCLIALDRLNAAESAFYAAIGPNLAGTEGATAIIASIERQSRQLRRDLAERAFP